MAAGKAPTRLKLDRGLGSPLFGSWRLDSEADVRHGAHGLPGRVQPPLAGGRGFLQTKTVVTHNHVHQQPGGTYVFLQDGSSTQSPPSVYRLDYIDSGAHGVATHRITGPLESNSEGAGGLQGYRLPPTLTEVPGCKGAPAQLLVSSGRGDLRLVPAATLNSAAALPSPLHPIRAAVPHLGVRPFLIETAWRSAAGQLQCVVSALRARSPDAPAACEVYVISLDTANSSGSTGSAADEAGDAESPALRVSDVCLLQTSCARPHAAVVDADRGALLLAVDPTPLAPPRMRHVAGVGAPGAPSAVRSTASQEPTLAHGLAAVAFRGAPAAATSTPVPALRPAAIASNSASASASEGPAPAEDNPSPGAADDAPESETARAAADVHDATTLSSASKAQTPMAAAAAAFSSQFTAAKDPASLVGFNSQFPPGLTVRRRGDTSAATTPLPPAAQKSDAAPQADAVPQPGTVPQDGGGDSDRAAAIAAALAAADAAENAEMEEEAAAAQREDVAKRDSVEAFDANPRSFEQAVANLNRFTSDQPAEDGPDMEDHLADIDGGGAGEDAPALLPDVRLLLFMPGPDGGLTQTDSLACGSHKLLGAAPAPQSTAATDSEGSTAKEHSTAVLLGLTDDVDAAVVRVAVGADGRIEASHLATVPALGYVAAGKVQKRAALFGMPGATVSAAIVEAHAYAFLYKAVPVGGQTGANAILRLGLPPNGLGVLGAALLPPAGPASPSTLLVLTEDAVHTFRWC